MSIDQLTSVVHPRTDIPARDALSDAPQSRHPATKDAVYSAAERPRTLMPIWENIPQAMRSRKQWVMWHCERRGSRWTKVPLRVYWVDKEEVRRAASDDPSTWTSFNNLHATYHQRWLKSRFEIRPEPGFVFATGGGMLGVDLDKVRNPDTGELSPLAARLVAELPGYWEVSPSGTGLKGFFFGSLPEV